MTMKSLLLLLLLTSATAQLGLAQTPTLEKVPVVTPRIKWLPSQMDVGKVPFGVPVARDFIVENNSDSVLLLTKVLPGCHCTTATMTLDPIAPGARGVVHVTFDALKEGEFYRVVIVYTNQDTEQPMGLVLKGKVSQKSTETGQ